MLYGFNYLFFQESPLFHSVFCMVSKNVFHKTQNFAKISSLNTSRAFVQCPVESKNRKSFGSNRNYFGISLTVAVKNI